MGIVKGYLHTLKKCHQAIVLNGYQGWTTQRSSAGGILGREWLQRRRMFRLRCHNFELVNQTSQLGLTKDIAIGSGGFGFLFGPILAVSLVVKHTVNRSFLKYGVSALAMAAHNFF